jgi:hypothetical protein
VGLHLRRREPKHHIGALALIVDRCRASLHPPDATCAALPFPARNIVIHKEITIDGILVA